MDGDTHEGVAQLVLPVPALNLEEAEITKSMKQPVLMSSASDPYALTPDAKWLHQSRTCSVLVFAFCTVVFLCCATPPLPFWILRCVYSFVGLVLFTYRIYYYYLRRWLFFLIDLCFVNFFVLVWYLWVCADEGQCAPHWHVAVYLICSGPVPGITFLLQIPLTFHHPEAHESFFLHASGQWVMYILRWREQIPDMIHAMDDSGPSFMDLMWTGLRYYYLLWIVPYWVCLLVQPFLPDSMAELETILDEYIFAGSNTAETRLNGKRNDYFGYVCKMTRSCGNHLVLCTAGIFAGALAYKSQLVAMISMSLVLLGGVEAGIRFYYGCAHPGYEKPGMHWSLARFGLAWTALGATYVAFAH